MSNDRLHAENRLQWFITNVYEEWKDEFITCAVTEIVISTIQDVNVKKNLKRMAVKRLLFLTEAQKIKLFV